MAEWRFGRGWTAGELRDRLARAARLEPNFSTAPEAMTEAEGWTCDGLDEVVGREPPGRPAADGLFERARRALLAYEFSDPGIVGGHFESDDAPVGRTLLLEIKVLGLRYLVGARIGAVYEDERRGRTTFGIRYDTLEGHLERGSEWVRVTKDHATGVVRLRIEARWRYGEFPNWWTALGFRLFAPYYRPEWRRRARERLGRLAEHAVGPARLPRRPLPGPVGPPPTATPPEPAEKEEEST